MMVEERRAMVTSGILFPDVRSAVAWGRLLCPLWLPHGFAVWPFIHVTSRGMVLCTHLSCCQGVVPRGSVIHHLPGTSQRPGAEYVATKFKLLSNEVLDVPEHLLKFNYIALALHLRFKDSRGKRLRKQPSLFDGLA